MSTEQSESPALSNAHASNDPHRDLRSWRLVAMALPLAHCPCGAVAYVRCLIDHTDRCFLCFTKCHPRAEESEK